LPGLGEVGRQHARLVRRQDALERGRGAAGEEVADALPRRRVGLAAEHVGARFPEALEGDAVERPDRAVRAGARTSSGVRPTTMPALALRSLREYWLMPLVTTRPGSEVAATTVPPGHMQKL
jgi:hypothetical protein